MFSFLQFSIILITHFTGKTTPDLHRPFLTERYVEVVCGQTPKTRILVDIYNSLLLVLCVAFSFVTRKLPENFNESRYIFINCITTGIIWSVFLPILFSESVGAYTKSSFIGFGMLMNCSVVLVCVYAPKLHALFYPEQRSHLVRATVLVPPRI